MTTTTRQLDCPNPKCKSDRSRPLDVLEDPMIAAWAKALMLRPESEGQWRRCLKCGASWDSGAKP